MVRSLIFLIVFRGFYLGLIATAYIIDISNLGQVYIEDETSLTTFRATLKVIKKDSMCTKRNFLWNCEVTECTGSIVSPSSVIAPAHCVHNARDPEKGLIVMAGARLKVSGVSQSVRGKFIYVHPNYDSKSGVDDIAVVVTEEEFVFNDYLKPVSLPEGDDGVKVGDKAALIGWGVSSDRYSIAPEYKVKTVVISNEDCLIYYNNIDGFVVCVDFKEHVTSCKGDDGSPLLVDGVLIGILKWMPRGCNTGRPLVFTKVSKYISWINEIVFHFL